ncbi:MAG: hypothetical protein J6I74_03015, partial [Schwartzia sp.]|nr:hypothetical protein [Schwartzia sp. (in: firmicutes)]
GRGSAAGSVVSYCLKITDVDPIKYSLFFERFLNPERVSMPDIDVDFCVNRRGEVIDYVHRLYGDDHVAQIVTFGTMAARMAIRDVGRVLDVSYADTDRGAKQIPAALNMTIDEAVEFFANVPSIARKMQVIQDVGLGYVRLGQPATTLSGGEAQRVKLATELSRRSTGRTLYILDEPTTGLHTADIEKLLVILQRLVDGGDTVIVIEHNLDVIKSADYIIDLGPEGGDKGGTIVAQGTPEEIAKVKKSYTGKYLKPVLKEKH